MRRDIFVVYMTYLVLGSGMIGCSTNDVIVNEHEHGNVHEHEHGNVHEHEHDISQTKVHISEMVKHGDLNISDVWARPGFSGGNTAVYMSLVNVGEEAEYLVGAESDICRAVEIHQISMKGDVMTMLPVSGDKDYPQAPFTTVYLPSEMVSHYGDGAMFVSGLIEVALNLWEDNLWTACDALLGLGQKVKGNVKRSWAKRCQKFADKYIIYHAIF